MSPAGSVTYRFQYFKGFGQAELRLSEPVTLLLGRNGAGKSNVLEGVHLFSHLVRGLDLADVAEPGDGRECEIRGGLAGCAMLGEEFFVLGCSHDDLDYEVAIRPSVEQVETESLRSGEAALFESLDRRENFRDASAEYRYRTWPSDPAGEQPAAGRFPTTRSVLSTYPAFLGLGRPGDAAAAEHMRRIDAWKRQVGDVWVFAPGTDRMRGYERARYRMGRAPLARDGSNLSAVLYRLSEGSAEDRATLARISESICRLPEEGFEALTFLANDETGDVLLAFRLPGSERKVDARLLSDGTLRYLAILTAVETLPEGAILVLEDFEAGLHPSRIQEMIEHVWRRCEARRLRALVTTHNPGVLDALTPDQLRGVVVCYRDRDAASARLKPLLEVADSDILLERGGLADLVTRGVLEQHLVPRFSEERRQKALDWLEQLP